MRIRYTYTEYKDFPTATDISEHREKEKTIGGGFTLFFMFFALMSFFAGIFENDYSVVIPSLLALAFFAFAMVYLFKFYDKVTEKK